MPKLLRAVVFLAVSALFAIGPAQAQDAVGTFVGSVVGGGAGEGADPAGFAVRGRSGPPSRWLPDRKETEVRRMLDVPHPPAPSDLAEQTKLDN